MTSVTHREPLPPDAARRVRALLEGALRGSAREEAVAHLRACAACVALYDRLADAEHRALGELPALDRVAGRLGFDGSGGRLAARGHRRSWISATAAAAALAVFAAIAPRAPWSTEWTARGTGAEAPGIAITVYRLAERDGRLRAVAIPGGTATRTSPRDRLGASYTNLAGHGWATWFAVPMRGSPVEITAWSGPVRGGVVDEPLDAMLDAAALGPGPVRIRAVFTAGRPTPGEAARLVESPTRAAGSVILTGP